MDLSPYLDSLRRDLAAAAAPGGPEVSRAAELLADALDASARLSLMAALADAADEVTAKLDTASVEVRLHGRDADLVVTEVAAHPEPTPAATSADGPSEVARITLRLSEGLKEKVEDVAAGHGVSVNAWLVRAINGAVARASESPPSPPSAHPTGPASLGRRVTGFAQA